MVYELTDGVRKIEQFAQGRYDTESLGFDECSSLVQGPNDPNNPNNPNNLITGYTHEGDEVGGTGVWRVTKAGRDS